MIERRTIGLCMIVKDEAHILRRCIGAVRPLLDFALIVDTGSSDGTPLLAAQILDELKLSGQVVLHPWRDFAHNRSHALALMRQHSAIDYTLMIDADDQVEMASDFDPAAFKQGLGGDVYSITTRMGPIAYLRPQLLSNRKPFFFKAVLHEFLTLGEPYDSEVAKGIEVRSIQDGARSRMADKFARDAQTLGHALETETDPFLRARYTFYLAQSYRDCGEAEKSIAAYLKRAEMGFWDQEVYCSLLYAARQMHANGADTEAVLAAYLRASALCPDRAEALHNASRLCRLTQQYGRGADIGEKGLGLAPPERGLFVETWIYSYGLRDEFAVNAYWADRWRESLDVCLELLEQDDLPLAERKRVVANARFSLNKLAPEVSGGARA